MDDLIKDPPPPGAAKALQDIIEGDDLLLSCDRQCGRDDGVNDLSGGAHGRSPSSQDSTFRTGLHEKLIYIYHTCCLKSIVCGKIRV